MVAEMGGFTGIVEPDEKTVPFLRERRGIDFKLEEWMYSDPAARYKETIRIDCGELSPMVARPAIPETRCRWRKSRSASRSISR